VNPAAMLATAIPREDAYVVEVNPDETAITPFANVHIADTAAHALPQLLDALAETTEAER
jgi:NAD-dependent SIR2 family protein deacetylase